MNTSPSPIAFIFLLLLSSFGAAQENVSTPEEAPTKPNILWIFTEDLSPLFGCYGDKINKDATPHIDALAKSGQLYTRAFAPSPVCSACRSALITGVYQTTTGTHQHPSSRFTNGQVVPENLRIILPDGITPIPQLLKDAGYYTFNQGKDDYNFHYNRHDLYSGGTSPSYQPGQNGWQGNAAENSQDLFHHGWNNRPDKAQPWFGQITLLGGKAKAKHCPEEKRFPPKVKDTESEEEGKMKDGELLAPPPYFPDTPAHRAAWTEHYNAARGTSYRVQEILDQLKADDELDNTVIIFFSDHGSNQSLRHKQFCYEGGLHIPLIIAGDHPNIRKGSTIKNLTNALDISATTLALAGLTLPDYLHGQNLLPEKTEDTPATTDHIVSARDRCDYTVDKIRTVRSDKFRYILNYHPDRPMLQAQYRDDSATVKDLKRLHQETRLSAYQSAHWFGPRPQEELYDLEKDPHQINNLAQNPDHTETLQQHRQLLSNWIHRTKDQGQQTEDTNQLKATYHHWKDKAIFKKAQEKNAINPEYKAFQ